MKRKSDEISRYSTGKNLRIVISHLHFGWCIIPFQTDTVSNGGPIGTGIPLRVALDQGQELTRERIMPSDQPTAVVAMSGGVDSSVVAGILKQQGYRLIGVTMLFRPCDSDDYVSWCCGANAGSAASGVCEQLGMEHYTLPCPDEFEAAVLRPAWNEYASGRTPSPCIHCNQKLKFGLLLDWAEKRGIELVASGHYARLIPWKDTVALHRGLYRQKDQSYFLFTLSAAQRRRLLFPLGELDKPSVRQFARSLGYANAERDESQDACFSFRGENFAESLRHRFKAPARSGSITDRVGTQLGSHDGIHNFTVGQRRGLGVALGKPAYVTEIDAANKAIIISDDPSSLEATELRARDLLWSQPDLFTSSIRCQVQIRYRHQPVSALITPEGTDQVLVEFDSPQRAVTPGQAVVFYEDDLVLGGGWIK